MIFMNFIKITEEYYAKWLGVPPEIMNSSGILYIESAERDKQQIGYSQVFDVYVYITENLVIVSYSKRLSAQIDKIKNLIHSGMIYSEITSILEEVFNSRVGSNIKFYYDKLTRNIDTTNVIKLSTVDFPRYLEFFLAQYPNANIDDWLEHYFSDITKSELSYGISLGNKLVSVTDAPSMPYMEDKVQEIGINTLLEYRGKGFAQSVSLAAIKSIIEKGMCPQWSCYISNTASEKLAYKIGFKKLANVLTVSV